MTHLLWIFCAATTWILGQSAEGVPYALVASFLTGIFLATAAHEHSSKRLKESEERAWRIAHAVKEEK